MAAKRPKPRKDPRALLQHKVRISAQFLMYVLDRLIMNDRIWEDIHTSQYPDNKYLPAAKNFTERKTRLWRKKVCLTKIPFPP